MERLASVADGPNDLREYKLPEWSEDLESTMSPSTPKFEELELMCLEELLQHGGRPVIRDIASLTSLTEKERKRLPWVHDPLFTEEVPRIFSRQADRWWDFMKWQADNRGPEAGDYGVSAYVATHLRRFSLSTDMSQSSELEDSLRRMWEVKMKRLEFPDPSLPAYQEAVKKRLASHHFTQEFRLEADPRKQDAWTTWVEYLNFEYWETDRLTASLGATERGYHDAWDNFRRIDTPQPSANFGARQEFYKDAPPEDLPLEFQLEQTRRSLEALQRRTDTFIRDTARHRRKEEAIHHQLILTRWIREQLRVIKAETAQQGTTGDPDQRKSPACKKRKNENQEASVEEGGRSVKRSKQDSDSGQDPVQQPARERPEDSIKAATFKGSARQLLSPRQTAHPQTNANSASHKRQSSSRRSCTAAMASSSPIRRRSQRLQAQLQEQLQERL
ncbi:hypothetical protein TrVGV298_006249 [Trichoderma virens]|nr:hypothetical protein TrVGV298_006249 [Trichoderma virens]